MKFPSTLLRASAGTGKTFAISNRYLALLLSGEDASKILATTFTRKAASEIKDRVFSRLVRATQSVTNCAELAQQLDLKNLELKQVRQSLWNLLQRQDRMQICTLDSFFVRIALSFAYEIGLPSNCQFVLTQDSVSQHQRLANFVVDSKLLTDSYSQIKKVGWGRSLSQTLFERLLKLDELAQESLPQAWKLESKLNQPEVFDELLLSMKQLEIPVNQKREKLKSWSEALERSVQAIPARDWKKLLSEGIFAVLRKGQSSYFKREIPDLWLNFYNQLFRPTLASVLRQELAERLAFDASLLAEFTEFQAQLDSQSERISFQTIKQLLVRSQLSCDQSDLYYRLDSKISHLLLDEFQDTSRLEWRILEPLLDEVISKAELDHSFLCVGDTKQAIYAWRGGVSESLDIMQARWPQLETRSLVKSYRCAPAILETVNQLVESFASNPALSDLPDLGATWLSRFESQQSLNVQSLGHCVLRRLPEQQSVWQEFVLKLEELASNPSISIAVLVRRNSDMQKVVNSCQASKVLDQIAVEGKVSLAADLAVQQIVSLLAYLDYPKNTSSYLQVKSSLLGKHFFDNPAQSVALLQLRIIEHGIISIIREACSVLFEHVSATQAEALRELLVLVRDTGEVSIPQLISAIKSHKFESSFTRQISVMTIHASKGLEFDAVLLPELSQRLVDNRSGEIIGQREHSLADYHQLLATPASYWTGIDQQIDTIVDRVNFDKAYEELSLMYVAMTRARYGLYMFTTNPASKACLAGILQAALLTNGTDIYTLGDQNWSKEVGKDCTTIKSQVAVCKPNLKKLKLESTVHLAPSSLEGGGSRSVKDLLSPSSQGARVSGIELHKRLEQIEWLEPSSEDSLKLDFSEQIRSLFFRSRYNNFKFTQLRLLREAPFLYRRKGFFFSGKIDRLVLGFNDQRVVFAEVIDFKGDRLQVATTNGLDNRLAYYRPQIELYSNAIQEQFALEAKAVKSVLAFINAGIIVEV